MLDKAKLETFLTTINPDSDTIDGIYIDKSDESFVDEIVDKILKQSERDHDAEHKTDDKHDHHDCKGAPFYIIQAMKAYLVTYSDSLSLSILLGINSRIHFILGRATGLLEAKERSRNPIDALLKSMPADLQEMLSNMGKGGEA